MVMVPLLEYLMAFERRLLRISVTRVGSAVARLGFLGQACWRVIPF